MAIPAKSWFWGGWAAALSLTVLLLIWHLPFSPFSTPGARANEAAVVLLMAMAVRWVILAASIARLAWLWASHSGSSGWGRAGMILAACGSHLILGLVNLGIWNAWLSVGDYHTRSLDAWLVAGYFLIPSGTLLALAIVASRLRARAT